jgi:putative transposase
MCSHLQVSPAGFYAWCNREPSARAQRDAGLLVRVQQIHLASRGYYGSPRVRAALLAQGLKISRGTVMRLMRQARLQGRSARLYMRSKVGQRAFFTSIANNERGVRIERRNQVWVGDVTYLRVLGQWRYLAVVLDKYSRCLIGWSISRQRDANLTTQALSCALRSRKPEAGLIFHRDRGIEYAAWQYRQKLTRHGIVQSMNRPGKMNDNAHMESFFHSMKTEELYGLTFATDEALQDRVLSYIQFYNRQRLHSSIGYQTPVAFDRAQAVAAGVHF